MGQQVPSPLFLTRDGGTRLRGSPSDDVSRVGLDMRLCGAGHCWHTWGLEAEDLEASVVESKPLMKTFSISSVIGFL